MRKNANETENVMQVDYKAGYIITELTSPASDPALPLAHNGDK